MAAAGLSPVLSEEERQRQRYPWWWVLPLQPYAVRKTIREELLPGRCGLPSSPPPPSGPLHMSPCVWWRGGIGRRE